MYYSSRLLLFLAASVAVCLASFAGIANAADEKLPNVVLVFADDKYEHGQPKVDNTGKKRLKQAFHQEFQITWNCGKLGQITGN